MAFHMSSVLSSQSDMRANSLKEQAQNCCVPTFSHSDRHLSMLLILRVKVMVAVSSCQEEALLGAGILV